MAPRLGVVVLAAGAGSRMGGVAKCLITLDGETLLNRLLAAMAPLQPGAVVLVVGPHAEAIQSALRARPPVQTPAVVCNPAPGDSPASSLRIGLEALDAQLDTQMDTVMVLLADQPLLTATDLQRTWQAFTSRAAHQRMLWPEHHGQPGHPVLLEACLARQWAAQTSTGLRPWAEQNARQILRWSPGNTHHTQDLDTLAELERLATTTGRQWNLPRL